MRAREEGGGHREGEREEGGRQEGEGGTEGGADGETERERERERRESGRVGERGIERERGAEERQRDRRRESSREEEKRQGGRGAEGENPKPCTKEVHRLLSSWSRKCNRRVLTCRHGRLGFACYIHHSFRVRTKARVHARSREKISQARVHARSREKPVGWSLDLENMWRDYPVI